MDIIIFARHWMPGQVKTRLCPPLTSAQAAAVHRGCLDLLVSRLRMLAGAQVTLAYAPASAHAAFRARYPGINLLSQRGDNLSVRMKNILQDLHRSCLFTGADCPTTPVARFQQGHEALVNGADVVLGPSKDGGSYLLGLDERHAGWFDDIPWSTAQVSETLHARAAQNNWQLHELPPWYDIDRIEDLLLLQQDLQRMPAREPFVQTAEVELRAMIAALDIPGLFTS